VGFVNWVVWLILVVGLAKDSSSMDVPLLIVADRVDIASVASMDGGYYYLE